MINDILKMLKCCGSFLVVDEEFSTVHFAHSSLKNHLLSKPTKLDIDEYHVDLFESDIELGKIVVTYLNLDVLSTQLTKTEASQATKSAATQTHMTNVPSHVIKSTLPAYDFVKRTALLFLKDRNTPETFGSDIWRGVNPAYENKSSLGENRSLLPYCQQFWLFHSRNFRSIGHFEEYTLWLRLISGRISSVTLPWDPEAFYHYNEGFLDWLLSNPHPALVSMALWQLTSFINTTPHEKSKYLQSLQSLLKVVPNDLEESPWGELREVFSTAVKYGTPEFVEAVLVKGVDVNCEVGNTTAVEFALESGKDEIARLLISKGADMGNLRQSTINLLEGNEKMRFFLQIDILKRTIRS